MGDAIGLSRGTAQHAPDSRSQAGFWCGQVAQGSEFLFRGHPQPNLNAVVEPCGDPFDRLVWACNLLEKPVEHAWPRDGMQQRYLGFWIRRRRTATASCR